MSVNTQPVQVGNLNEEELAEFTRVRNVASQMIQQLGSLELKKSRLVSDLNDNEESAQKLLSQARERVGLSENTPWQIREDGTIFAMQTTEEESSSEEVNSEGS